MLTNILQYLENTVSRVPDKIAFSDGESALTFRELYESARRVGTFLLEKGMHREGVAVFMKRHPSQLTAFFGAIYAGCFYVPLDDTMPAHRIELILDSTKCRVMICDKKTALAAEKLNFDGEILVLDDILDRTPAPDAEALDAVRERQIDTDPIYIVFTSGSTGIPKGVAACHRSVIDYTEALCEAVPFDSDTVFGNQTPLFFDAPLKEIMPTLKYGATTYFIPKKLFMFPMMLSDFLNEHKINTVCWVVSALTMISSLGVLEKNPPKHLRLVCFGSEVFPKKQYELWRSTYADVPFYNLYGPTEATGMSCYWRANRALGEKEPIPVGRPFKNTAVMLISDDGREIKKSDEKTADENGNLHTEAGEIYIRGTCVTLGYFNNPEKTSEAFVQNPLNKFYNETVYKTGDMACYNERGELVFISRRDSQIKHMGHRIELGEIESAAASIDGVRQACAVYVSEKSKLGLFYVGDIESAELLKRLKSFLPKYMIPTSLKKLDAMPLTPNGKLDRKLMKNIMEEEA